MKKKVQIESTPSQRRKALEKDVAAFLEAGNNIQYIDDGVSAQDPQGKGRPLRLGQPNEKGGTSSTESHDGNGKPANPDVVAEDDALSRPIEIDKKM